MLASLVLAGAALSFASESNAATRYDWRFRFRTLTTRHFEIHFHQGEAALARRVAAIAEEVRDQLDPALGRPAARVHVILVDQNDLPNGWATPVPRDTIEITATPPSGDSLIGNTDDWLRLVLTHEYTHIVHLDRSRGWIGGLRRVFGRVPVLFPNQFLPVWQIEGIATDEESAMTGGGRVPDPGFRTIVDVAAANSRFESIDRASGGLVDWPSGIAPYAYGAYFHQFLVDRYGAEKLRELSDATAGRIPYFGAGAFRRVYGRSVGALWDEFARARERDASGRGRSVTDANARRLTSHGFVVDAPRFAPDGILYYSVANADGFPALMQLDVAGGSTRVAWRYLGTRTAPVGDWIVFDQLQFIRSTDLRSDLYAVRRSQGSVRRLTHGARAADADVSSTGRVVCIIDGAAHRALATTTFADGKVGPLRTLVADADAVFAGPRWSPDGARIVAERRLIGGPSELVFVDPASGATNVVAEAAGARLVTPAWMPDGRTVMFASDRDGVAFNLYALDVTTGAAWQITDSRSGARSPEPSPDGRRVVYVGYTVQGYDLFELPIDRSTWRPLPDDVFRPKPAPAKTATQASGERAGDRDRAKERSYQPWRTLLPTWWTPTIASDAGEVLLGAATAMTDVLGWHSYAAGAAWTGGRARPDWTVAYAYDRWPPTLFASYSDDTDPITAGTVRSREAVAGALLRIRRVRETHTWLGAFDAERDDVSCDACAVPRRSFDRRSFRAGWLYDSRRAYGYSIGPEEGVQLETAIELTRRAIGADDDATAAIGDARGYWRLFGRHTVLAARAAGAASWGAASARRTYGAGGPGPVVAGFDFGHDSIGLLRGFGAGAIDGTHAAVANVDLRVPLLRIQRGIGTWPVFLSTLHGAAFFDAGDAWDRNVAWSDLRSSTGVELSLDTVLGHYFPVTFAAGVALTRDPAGDRRHVAVFGRIGRAF